MSSLAYVCIASLKLRVILNVLNDHCVLVILRVLYRTSGCVHVFPPVVCVHVCSPTNHQQPLHMCVSSCALQQQATYIHVHVYVVNVHIHIHVGMSTQRH